MPKYLLPTAPKVTTDLTNQAEHFLPLLDAMQRELLRPALTPPAWVAGPTMNYLGKTINVT